MSDARNEDLALVRALFERKDRGRDGEAAFAIRYPAAPHAMVHTAAFHVYVDGCEAALRFLSQAERFLCDPSDDAHDIDYGITYELIYHLYNWLQFQALLPDGKPGLLELLGQLKQFVAEDEREAIVAVAQEIEDALEGTRSLPDVD